MLICPRRGFHPSGFFKIFKMKKTLTIIGIALVVAVVYIAFIIGMNWVFDRYEWVLFIVAVPVLAFFLFGVYRIAEAIYTSIAHRH